MIKQSTTAGSPYALLAVTPEHGVNLPVQLQPQHRRCRPPRRPMPGSSSRAPGDTITSFASADGQTWTEVGTATVDLDGDRGRSACSSPRITARTQHVGIRQRNRHSHDDAASVSKSPFRVDPNTQRTPKASHELITRGSSASRRSESLCYLVQLGLVHGSHSCISTSRTSSRSCFPRS